ncbi:unnamed protein product [Symbiodinium microadriaticum]|nr:unnamed protein product [Symbiodinium microadriaticum]
MRRTSSESLHRRRSSSSVSWHPYILPCRRMSSLRSCSGALWNTAGGSRHRMQTWRWCGTASVEWLSTSAGLKMPRASTCGPVAFVRRPSVGIPSTRPLLTIISPAASLLWTGTQRQPHLRSLLWRS